MVNSYRPKIGSFKNAMEALLNERKVRRITWDDDCYLFIDQNECLVYEDGEEGDLDTNDTSATDWEIFEEPTPNDTIDSLEAAFKYLREGWCVRSKSWGPCRYVKLEYTESMKHGKLAGLYNQHGHEVTGVSLIIPAVESWEILGGAELFPGISEPDCIYHYKASGSFITEEKE